jgi:FHS family Na+ dependent glucose MFS transporter 1
MASHNLETSADGRISATALRATMAYSAAFLVLGAATAIIGPTLPKLAEHTATSLGEIGFLFTGANLGYMLGSLGIGRLIDRIQGHFLLALALMTMAGMLALIPIVDVLWLLVVVLFLLGFAEGAMDVSTNVFLVWFHHQRANPFLNGLHFFFGAGAFLSPIIVSRVLIANQDIHWAYWILAICPLPIALWVAVLRAPVSPHTETKSADHPQSWALIGSITLIFVFYVGAETGFGGWIYTYATTMHLADLNQAALLTSIFWGALTIGRLAAIPISIRLRPAIILSGDFAGSLLSLLLIWVFPGSKAAVWAGALGLGFFMASIFPTLLAFSERHLMMSGLVSRWFFVGTGLGGMVIPWLLGIFIEKNGPESIIPALWACVLFGMFAYGESNFLFRKQTGEYND